MAGADGQTFLKNLPQFKGQPATTEIANWQGQWKASGENYEVTLAYNGENRTMTAETSGARLTLKDDKNTWVFDRN